MSDTSLDANTTAKYLSLYIDSITGSNALPNSMNTLGVKQVDEIVGRINQSLAYGTTKSFIMVQELGQGESFTVLGASFTRGSGGKVVKNTTNEFNNSSISIGALIHGASSDNLKSLNILIIDTPTSYEKLNNSNNDTQLASSVIVVNPQRNNDMPINISLYFQVLEEYKPTVESKYSCSYYDTNAARWSDVGCTKPMYNESLKRHECSCNHTTTFALVWSPNIIPCETDAEMQLENGTCVLKSTVQV